LSESVFNSVLVIFKPSQKCIETARKTSDYLRRLGVEVETIWVDDFIRLENRSFPLIVLVGGDGTFLRFSRLTNGESPLILPIPCGRRLAFYEEIPLGELESYIDRVFHGDFYIEHLPRVKARVEKMELNALNEVLVANIDQGRVGSFKLTIHTPSTSTEVSVDCDGVIVGPSPGSSAYNLSARGPLIESTYPSIFINFLNPLQLNLAPVILPFLSRVRVEAATISSLYIDGDRITTIHDVPVEVSASWEWLRVIRFNTPRRGLFNVLAKRAL
jgi:NAD+ kinase